MGRSPQTYFKKFILHSQFSILNLGLEVPAILLLLSVSCGAAAKSSPTPTPAPAAGAAVILPSGARYRVELARTPEEQAQGLMFRETLPPNAGMLFLFPAPDIHKFWMKNTMIPLDIIWMDSAGKVVFVSANTPQCRADPCPTYGPEQPAANVLEIAAGRAKKENVEIGSVIRFEGVDVVRKSPKS